MNVSVVGLGKLGAPLVAVLASKGLSVYGIDVNPDAVAHINAGLAPVQEPQLQELLHANSGRIRATSDWATAIGETEATYIIVPTPSGADGAFRNDYVLSAIEEIGRVLAHKPGYHLVVVNSTTMPGAVGGPIRDRLEAISGKRVGHDIGLCYNPEFIALGNVIEGLLRPDFVLIGESDARAGGMLEEICRRIVGPSVPVCRMNFVNAELTKISVNTYVTTKISFANMLGEICDRLPGADADVVTAAIGRDARIGAKYLRGATGYGGPCFPRDTIAFSTMAQRVGVEASLAAATHEINERQVERLTGIVAEHTGSGDRIAVLGLSYKPDTGVIERSQGIMLAAALARSGREVVAHDPLAIEAARAALGAGVSLAASPQQAVEMADAVIVMVPWPEYKEFFASWPGDERPRLIIDCWRVLAAGSGPPSLRVMHPGNNESLAAAPGAAPNAAVVNAAD
ncbi:MAG TPA: nucleotide sugar dehydrogenase [Stellaceae bacterium]|jgi:UDPglucose 6-dehydrogenase|nr:nucleotide sugar dehydrogenase [Stellaceae bacterium]